MKSKLISITLAIFSCMAITSCSKYEKIDPTPNPNPPIPMFIGVHTSNANLIVGFTNSDGSFTQTDMLTGPFILSPNQDKHTSAFSLKKNRFYFLFKNGTDGLLNIGTVRTDSGIYYGDIGLNFAQDDMVHLQFSDDDDVLYFSMGVNIYQHDFINNGFTNITQVDNQVKLPANYSAGSSYSAHTIDSKRFSYIRDDKDLMVYNRSTKQWDSLALPQSGSYRSLVVDETDRNIMYAYVLTGTPDYKLVKINLSNSTVTDVVKASNKYEFLWFQNRYCPDSKLYTGLPFDRQTFPYFIAYDVDNGESKRYTTPSYLGQCILK